jgi:hypothetical protein
LTLGFGAPRSQRGRPILADAESGRRIIERLRRLSAAFGTSIYQEDGVGVVRLTDDRSR